MAHKRMTALAAGAVSLALLAAGCGQAPADGGSTNGAKSDFKPCMISDSGGFDDKSFNQSGKEGLDKAAQEIGVTPIETESHAEADFPNNMNSLVGQNCNLIVSVGFLLKSETENAAKANPDMKFAILDEQITANNVKSIIFDTSQAAFMAGYSAAASSKTKVVGTYGGMKIPTVTIFMDGFAKGVEYFNKQKNDTVKVVGWDVAKQDGVFTGGFEAGTQAKSSAQTLIDQNADVILPVGGPIFLSAAEAIQDANAAGKSISMVGVDTDLYVSEPKYKAIYLTSIVKEIGTATKQVVVDTSNDKFSSDPYVGTLKNNGVSIAPFHDFESKVPSTLQKELDEIKQGIIDGKIDASSQASPKA